MAFVSEERYEQSADMRLLDLQRRAIGAAPHVLANSVHAEFDLDPSRSDAAPAQGPAGTILAATIDAQPRIGLIPGALVTVSLAVLNEGNMAANSVRLCLPLPLTTVYRPGTFVIDGDAKDDAHAGELFAAGVIFDRVDAGQRRTAVVRLVVQPGTTPLVLTPHVSSDCGAVLGPGALRLLRASVKPLSAAPLIERPFYESDDTEHAEEPLEPAKTEPAISILQPPEAPPRSSAKMKTPSEQAVSKKSKPAASLSAVESIVKQGGLVATAVETKIAKPMATKPTAVESKAGEPKAAKVAVEAKIAAPKAAQPSGVEFLPVQPKAAKLVAVDSRVVEPKAAKPLAIESKIVESKAARPMAGESKSVEPKATRPVAGESKTVEPKAAKAVAGESKTVESKAAKSVVGESKTVESKTVESKTFDSQAPKPVTLESKIAELKAAKPVAVESKIVELPAAKPMAFESKIVEPQTVKPMVGESKVVELPVVKPMALVVARGGPVLTVRIGRKRLATLARLFSGPSLGMIAHYFVLNALAATDPLEGSGTDASLAAFVAEQETLLSRALIATRLGKTPAPQSVGAALPAFPPDTLSRSGHVMLHLPADGEVLLVRAFDTSEMLFIGRMLANDQSPPFLRSAQLFVGLCANDAALSSVAGPQARSRVAAALGAYAAAATAEISRIFLRAKLTRKPALFKDTDPSFDDEARNVLAALGEVAP